MRSAREKRWAVTGKVLTRGVIEREPRRVPLGEGAAQAAPTAPHATPSPTVTRKRTGPERFWARRYGAVAFLLSLLGSTGAHYAALPFSLPESFEVKDVEGEAQIPIDVLTAEAPPPEPAPAAPSSPPERTAEDEAKDLAAARRVDAGRGRDDASVADVKDAAPIEAAAEDAATARARSDAASDDGAADGASLAMEDGGAMVGAAIQADVNLVVLVINAEVIRQHPLGARLGSLLRGIPQWEEFMSGTDVDPVRDADWVQIAGPSLINTARDVVLIHYSVSDTVVDHAVAIVGRKYNRGGAFDAGVPGVKATLAHADRAERVLLRAQPHVLAVVPRSIAEKSARQLVAARLPPHNHPGEAVYLRLVNPNHPMPEIPASITEMRLRVVPRADNGADVFIEGDTKDRDAAADAAGELRRVVRRHDDALTSMLTHGLFDHVDVTAEGAMVKAHLLATLDQLETVTALVSSFLGVEPPAPATAPGPKSAPH